MVKIQIGVWDHSGVFIHPSKMKCLECGAVFNYPYCDWAGGIYVIHCCPGCRKPITEYTGLGSEATIDYSALYIQESVN